jgi:NAD(P)-dependent dehydrogenase (short-subunit alcohol dehydrogenase family)
MTPRCILITGAGSGIGAGIAAELARAGHHLVVTDVNLAAARSVADDILVDKQIADQARTRGIPESQVVSDVMLKPMPKGVFITFEELAGVTAFLISPAARNITGHTIDVDGGWTVQ